MKNKEEEICMNCNHYEKPIDRFRLGRCKIHKIEDDKMVVFSNYKCGGFIKNE